MIQLYAKDATDFSVNGLRLMPKSCSVHEILNGMWELEMEHPLDNWGFWRQLEDNAIIKAPVPVRNMPTIDPEQGVIVYWRTINNTAIYSRKAESESWSAWVRGSSYWNGAIVEYNGVPYQLHTDPHFQFVSTIPPPLATEFWSRYYGGSYKIKNVPYNTEFVLIEYDAEDDWIRVRLPDGTEGYMRKDIAEYSREEYEGGDIPFTKRVREQLFRIYEIEKNLSAKSLRVRARHIMYDLLGNIIESYTTDEAKLPVSQIGAAILSGTEEENPFTFSCTVGKTMAVDWKRKNPVECFLGEDDGIVSVGGITILRDNYDIYAVKTPKTEASIRLAYAKNLRGVVYTYNTEKVIATLIPVGKDAQGDPLYLPERVVRSTMMQNYAIPHIAIEDCADADMQKVEGLTQEQAYIAMREYCRKRFFDDEADIPDITVDVDFLLIGDTEEYAAYKDLEKLFIGDKVPLYCSPLGIETNVSIVEYEYDAILQRYTRFVLKNLVSETDRPAVESLTYTATTDAVAFSGTASTKSVPFTQTTQGMFSDDGLYTYGVYFKLYNYGMSRSGVRIVVNLVNDGQRVNVYDVSGLSAADGEYFTVDTRENPVQSSVNVCQNYLQLQLEVTVYKSDGASSLRFENGETWFIEAAKIA